MAEITPAVLLGNRVAMWAEEALDLPSEKAERLCNHVCDLAEEEFASLREQVRALTAERDDARLARDGWVQAAGARDEERLAAEERAGALRARVAELEAACRRHNVAHSERSLEMQGRYEAMRAVESERDAAEQRVREVEARLSDTERACEVMHDAYEAAAKREGWETQERSRKPWADVPEANKATMRAAVGALARHVMSTTK